jgi:hypothetical protein
VRVSRLIHTVPLDRESRGQHLADVLVIVDHKDAGRTGKIPDRRVGERTRTAAGGRFRNARRSRVWRALGVDIHCVAQLSAR